MSSPILVTGGTGVLGQQVVSRLREAGREVRVLSRHARERAAGVDYVACDLDAGGTGADAALAGVEIILHCAGTNKGDADKARHLVDAARAAGTVRHLVFISVVGADRIPPSPGAGYFAEKLASEQVVTSSGIPWTILRATQFYSLLALAGRGVASLPLVPVPAGWRFQPIDAGEVAERLVQLALGSPAGLVDDMGGPKVYAAKELVRSYLRARGKRRLVVPVRVPGKASRALREGANLTREHAVGHRTWEEFLDAEVRPS